MSNPTRHNTSPKAGAAERRRWSESRAAFASPGIPDCCRLSRRGRAPSSASIRNRVEPCADSLRLGSARGRLRQSQEESGAPRHRPLCMRNPLYLGSTLIAAGFAVALLSWPVALLLAFGFAAIYIPVIASEERFLRATFPMLDVLPQRSRFIPRLTPAKLPAESGLPAVSQPVTPTATGGFYLPFTSSTASTILL